MLGIFLSIIILVSYLIGSNTVVPWLSGGKHPNRTTSVTELC